jgi:hypothetical protein
LDIWIGLSAAMRNDLPLHLRHVGVAAGVEPGSHDVDDLDAALIPRPGLEQFLLTGAHGAALELLLHDQETFFNCSGIGAGAVAAQQELHHVGGHRVVAGVFAHQVLADQEAIKGHNANLIELIHLAGGQRCWSWQHLKLEQLGGLVEAPVVAGEGERQ